MIVNSAAYHLVDSAALHPPEKHCVPLDSGPGLGPAGAGRHTPDDEGGSVAGMTRVVTPADAGVQAVLHCVPLDSGVRRNDEFLPDDDTA